MTDTHTSVIGNRSNGPQHVSSPAKPSRPARVTTTLFIAATITVLTACSNTDPQPTSAASSAPASTIQPADPTAAALDRLTGGRTVAIDTATLPKPPAGYTADEVAAFADRAIDIMKRGVDPALSAMTEDAAFEYVFANQYPASTAAARKALEAGAGKYSWAWAFASRYPTTPTQPAKVLAVRWQATIGTKTGDKAPLQLALSVAFQQDIPDNTADNAIADGDSVVTVPILVQRTVVISGPKPLGGETWWPGIGVQVNPLFGGKCAPINGSVLTPAHNPATLNADLARLTKYLNKPTAIDVQAASDATDLKTYVDKYCEDQPLD